MYESFFNLTGKPFTMRPDARFFFPSRSHKRAMAYLQYGLEQGEGFIVITGDIGTGKTTLVQNLFAKLDRTTVQAAQLSTTQLDEENLLRMVAASYGLEYEGMSKVALLKSLERFFIRITQTGKRVLLVIDEAQNMPRESLEELRMLSNLQVSNVPVLQIFLLGQREFNRILQSQNLEQLRQRVIASYQLKSLNREEVQKYVEHRLKLVGWNGRPEIVESSYDLVHAYTAGIPRRINTLYDRILLYAYLEETMTIDESVVNAVIQELQEEIAPPPEIRPDSSSQERLGSEELQRRLESLEARVTELEDALQLERARLRALTLNGG